MLSQNPVFCALYLSRRWGFYFTLNFLTFFKKNWECSINGVQIESVKHNRLILRALRA